MNINRTPYILIAAMDLVSCSSKDQSPTFSHESNGLIKDLNIQKTVPLDHDFKIEVGQRENFTDFETYTLFKLTRAGKELYIDTSFTEYEFRNSLYPLMRARENGTHDILVEINDRPTKNYLKYFKVRGDTILCVKNLPTFDGPSSNMDEDVNPEFAGTWDWGETWGENNSLTAYNPTIYYEETSTGIYLDSSLTIRKNTEKYGTFYGFSYGREILTKDVNKKK
jgi:hypothetical protein